MFRRIFNYLKTAFGMKAEAMMDPSVQIEQAVNEARRQDAQLREQAARVVAHRSEVQMKLDRAVEGAAKAKQNAGQALMRLDEAQKGGDSAAIDKWQRAAQSFAMELETQERLVDGLKTQYTTASEQAELAKRAVNDNALRLRELTNKRMELVGKLEQAKMQESVNKTLEQINRPMEAAGPSLTEIEDKINRRMASASATAELESNSLEGAQRELESAAVEAGGMARLDALRAELGIGGGDGGGSATTSPAGADTRMLEQGDDAAALQELAREHSEVPAEQDRS